MDFTDQVKLHRYLIDLGIDDRKKIIEYIEHLNKHDESLKNSINKSDSDSESDIDSVHMDRELPTPNGPPDDLGNSDSVHDPHLTRRELDRDLDDIRRINEWKIRHNIQ